MATPTNQWVHLAIVALLGLTLTSAHMVKPPKPNLDHVVKPPKLDLKHVVKPPKLDPNHVVKPPKADMDHVVKPPKPDLDHVVKPPKADLDHVVKPPKADMDHVVKPPKSAGLRKLQMDNNGEFEAGKFWAGEPDPDDSSSQIGWEQGGEEGGGIFGGGHGIGGTSFGFRHINPSPVFPFGVVVPEVSMWGEGGGYGGSNAIPGVQCQCSNGFTMHYTMTPNNFRPMDTMRKDGTDDMARSPPSG